MRYEAVFLDMGFTLVEFVPSFEGIYCRACLESGVEVSEADAVEAIQVVWNELAERDLLPPSEVTEETALAWQRTISSRILARLGIADDLGAEIVPRVDALFSDPGSYRVYDEAPLVLSELRASSLRMGIVSNWDWHLPGLCLDLGIDHYFDFIVTSARVGASKPDPRIFEEAFQRSGVPPARTVHIGDSYRADVMGAREAGADAVLLRRGDKPLLELADMATGDGVPVIRNLEELLPLVLG